MVGGQVLVTEKNPPQVRCCKRDELDSRASIRTVGMTLNRPHAGECRLMRYLLASMFRGTARSIEARRAACVE